MSDRGPQPQATRGDSPINYIHPSTLFTHQLTEGEAVGVEGQADDLALVLPHGLRQRRGQTLVKHGGPGDLAPMRPQDLRPTPWSNDGQTLVKCWSNTEPPIDPAMARLWSNVAMGDRACLGHRRTALLDQYLTTA